MAQHGGYRAPSAPAPVSGPGALSRRTDGGPAQAMRDLPNARYGENAEFRSDESGAPMAAAPALPPPGGGGSSPAAAAGGYQHPMTPPVPLTADTTMPNTPVTDGAPAGPGAMSMNLPQPNAANSAMSVLQRAAAAGGSQAQALLARAQGGL